MYFYIYIFIYMGGGGGVVMDTKVIFLLVGKS